MKLQLKPCKKQSRPVDLDNEAELQRVIEEGQKMADLCMKPMGKFPAALALAHCQVDHEDPLRFFATADRVIYINPIITDKDGKVTAMEGCYDFPFRDAKKVARYSKIRASFYRYSLFDQQLERIEDEPVEDRLVRVFQHEIDHFLCRTIY